MQSVKRPIRILPSELADQIAAGEVVERPASVLKELVENALDAGAGFVRVDVERGGQGVIRVQDDGLGMSPDEMRLAVLRHATSKIGSVDELFSIKSFGFRGEALPSIGSVSELTITSQPREGGEAAFLRVERGKIVEEGPAALKPGTRVEVRDLFGAVPARLKFLKSLQSETARCREAFFRIALAHPAVGFALYVEGREIAHFPAGQAPAGRLGAVWPPYLTEDLIHAEKSREGFGLTGLLGRPAKAQPRADRMLFYVNGRPVSDRILLKAVKEAYEGRLQSREYPQTLLFFDVPADEVDVNVHPAKNEVRFRDEGGVYVFVRRAVREALSAELDATITAAPARSIQAERIHSLLDGAPPPRASTSLRKGEPDPVAPRPAARPEGEAEPVRSARPGSASHQTAESSLDGRRVDPPLRTEPVASPTPEKPADSGRTPGAVAPQAAEFLGVVDATYLVFSLSDGGLGLLDQHAAHERILYERFKRDGFGGDSRPLAFVQTLPLHPAQAEVLFDWTDSLRKMGYGFTVEGGALKLSAVPASLDLPAARGLLEEVLSGKTLDADSLWTMSACRNALKARTPLAESEARTLFAEWLAAENREYCPHGRPAFVRLGPADLERLFKRRT